MSTRGQMTRMTMNDGASIGVYRVAAPGPRLGGLVLIQEIFGVTEHIQEQADRFAAAGYEVLAPALFDREQPNFQASYEAEDRQRAITLARELHPFKQSVADAQTCIDALAPEGPVFITGFCYGGTVVWAAACRGSGLAAASGYYGGQIPAMAGEKPKCPTILHFGQHDASIPMEGVEKVGALHPDVPVHVYDAGHGFNSDRRPDYNAAASALAFQRTLEWFAAHAPSSAPKSFADALKQLPPVTDLAALDLLDDGGTVVHTIFNRPGQGGSLAVYAALAQRFGVIDANAAREGLAWYAEHTADARANPGKHPNIDRLLALAEESDDTWYGVRLHPAERAS